jgi:lysophospholipase L1-like esterase
MRQVLVLLIVVAAVLLMPRGHAIPESHADPPEIATDEPALPVVFMGDSVTMGAFASTPEDMFVWRVRRDLESRGIDARNDSIWSLEPYDDLVNAKRVAESHRQLIILEIGVHWYGFSSSEFREVYGALLDCLNGNGARLVIGTIPWLNWEQGDWMYNKMSELSQIIREEGAKRGIEVADLWAATVGREDAISHPDEPCFVRPACWGDDYHPGDVGHALIAEAYSKALDVALAKPPPAATGGSCDFDAYLRALKSGELAPIDEWTGLPK